MRDQAGGAGSILDQHDGTARLVSVIVPVYNHEAYVATCLDSIASGSYRSVEIIIIEDSSRDRSDEVIRAWIADHPTSSVRYIRHTANKGLTKSLNEAIALARGEFICIIAGDDMMLPDGIAVRVDYLMQYPRKLAVFGDAHVIDEGGNQIFESGIEDWHPSSGIRKRLLAIDEMLPYQIVYHWNVPGPVFMCRAEVFDVVGRYDEGLAIEDWDMYMRIAATGRLGFLDAYVANYRLHSANTSKLLLSRWYPEAAHAAKKNFRQFDVINALRLVATYFHARKQESGSILGRVAYGVPSWALLFVSYRTYCVKRAIVLRRYRIKTAS